METLTRTESHFRSHSETMTVDETVSWKEDSMAIPTGTQSTVSRMASNLVDSMGQSMAVVMVMMKESRSMDLTMEPMSPDPLLGS